MDRKACVRSSQDTGKGDVHIVVLPQETMTENKHNTFAMLELQFVFFSDIPMKF